MRHLAAGISNLTKPKYEGTIANDSRLARRWRRRNIKFEGFEKRDAASKPNMNHTLNSHHIIVDDDDDDIRVSNLSSNSRQEDDVLDDDDPQYRVFLAQLKQDGYSYALEVFIHGKIQTLLKYDEADEDSALESTPKDTTDRQSKDCVETSNDFLCNSSAMDESYRVFLMNLISDGENMVYADEFSNRIVYEDNGDFTNVAESVLLAADSLQNGSCASSIRACFAAEVEEEFCIETPARSPCSLYRDNLMDYLVRPYDAAEYRELMLEASIRRPMGKHRELRGRTKSYSSELRSKSYLDHHKDFAAKIGLYENDHPKALNLLRGFFYWLKNLSHEGAFRPWSDEQCFNSEFGDKKDVCYMDVEVVKEIN